MKMECQQALTVSALRTEHIGPIEFVLNEGETVALRGSSGAGKTLLLRAIADLDSHEGEVRLEARSYLSYSPSVWRKNVALLFAQSSWWGERPADNFSQALPEGWLTALGLSAEIFHQDLSGLSEGERQRLALLRVLMNEPKVLLLDEPSSRLDNENTLRLEDFVAEYQARTGVAILWVSHDERQIARVATRVIEMRSGVLVAGEKLT